MDFKNSDAIINI